jgi:hypothetical protein
VDGTGLEYLRNRVYDSQSGRFTQEDPIGLAGGLNLYGFAGGDPANFSDPFGLCPNRLAGGLGALACAITDAVFGGRVPRDDAAVEAGKSVVVYAKGSGGPSAAQVEVDLAGRYGLRTGGEAGTDIASAAIGIRADVSTASRGGRTVTVTSPGVRVVGPVKLSGTLTYEVGQGIGGIVSVGVEVGVNASIFGARRNAPGVSTAVKTLPAACGGPRPCN